MTIYSSKTYLNFNFRSKRNDSIWISSKIFGETKRRNYKLLVQNNSIQLDEGIIDFSIVNVTSVCVDLCSI